MVGFGGMIGVGWLVVMDGWLQRGGPIGAMLGFFLGASLLLPVGYVYSKLVITIPDANDRAAGAAVSLGLISMKVLPMVPGHFSLWEWIALTLWLGLGFAVKQKSRQEPVSETSTAAM